MTNFCYISFIKTQSDRSHNHIVRAENESFHCENMAMKNTICTHFDGPPIGEEEIASNLENMKMKN